MWLLLRWYEGITIHRTPSPGRANDDAIQVKISGPQSLLEVLESKNEGYLTKSETLSWSSFQISCSLAGERKWCMNSQVKNLIIPLTTTKKKCDSLFYHDQCLALLSRIWRTGEIKEPFLQVQLAKCWFAWVDYRNTIHSFLDSCTSRKCQSFLTKLLFIIVLIL